MEDIKLQEVDASQYVEETNPSARGGGLCGFGCTSGGICGLGCS